MADYLDNGKYLDGKYSGYNGYRGYSHYGGGDDDDSGSFNIMEWVMLFVRNWYFFVAALMIALFLGYVKNRSWQPQYYSEAKVMIEFSQNSGYSFMQGFGGGFDYTHTNNQLLVLGSYDFINRTVSALPFDVDMYQRGRFKTNSLYGREPIRFLDKQVSEEGYQYEYRFKAIDNTHFQIIIEDQEGKERYPHFIINGEYGRPIECPFFFATIAKLYMSSSPYEFLFRFRSPASLEIEFASRLSLSYIGEASSVVGLSLVGNVVSRDIDFLDALCQEFIERDLEEKNQEAKRTIDFISEQLEFLSDSLQSSEIRLRKFRRENKLVDISSYTSGLLTKLTALDEQRSQMRLQEAYFDELSNYLTKTVHDETLMAPSSLGVPDEVLMELVSQYNELYQKRSDVGESNPNYAFYTRQIEDVKSTLLTVLENVKRVHQLERNAFNEEYDRVNAQINSLPEKELKMLNYERTYKINDNYYTFLLQKQSEAKIRMASNVSDNKILQKARVQRITNGGVKRRNYLIFALGGLAIPGVILVLIELLNATIRTEEEIKKAVGPLSPNEENFSVIGQIRHSDSSTTIASVRYPKSIFAEGFRLVRARIELLTHRKKNLLLLTSSAESGDGKTLFSANLAGVYGMISKKVLLIDMDLRNPKLTEMLKIESHKGLIHHLVEGESLEDCIIKDERYNFDFLTAGIVPPNPSEVMRSIDMANMLKQLKEKYDYVLVDTSPLGLVGDAYGISQLTDINLLAVRFAKTNKSFFKNFIRQIRQDKMPNTYLIFNDLPSGSKRGSRNSYGYYGRYSSTGYYTSSKYYHNAKYYTQEEDSE